MSAEKYNYWKDKLKNTDALDVLLNPVISHELDLEARKAMHASFGGLGPTLKAKKEIDMEHGKNPFGEALVEFLNAVEAMREAQKYYFKTRNSDDLKRSKELERKVDNMVAYIRKPKLF